MDNKSEAGVFQKVKLWAKRLKNEIVALYYAYRDPKVPILAKIFTACVVAYALSPIDLIPDFIPVLGYLDDIIILPLFIAVAVRMIPAEIMDESREKAKLLAQKPKNWVTGTLVLVIWILVLLWSVDLFVRYFY